MRLWYWIGLLLLAVLVGLAAFLFVVPQDRASALTLAGDAGRGAEVLRLGGCVSCHTDSVSGGALLAGGPALVTQFGTFHAPNITPHPEAGIGGWTLAQFAEAMRNGVGSEGHLYPIFPYEHYTLMSDQEVADLYAAINEVTPSDTVAPPHELGFPFNIRPTLGVWKALFFRPGRYVPDPTRSEAWNRGRYLATGPAHCIACHTPRNLLGALETGQAFDGNRDGGPGGRTPAITAEELRDEDYDTATLVDALKTGFTPGFDVLGGAMGEVIRDSTSHWADADLEALAAFLLDEGRGADDEDEDKDEDKHRD